MLNSEALEVLNVGIAPSSQENAPYMQFDDCASLDFHQFNLAIDLATYFTEANYAVCCLVEGWLIVCKNVRPGSSNWNAVYEGGNSKGANIQEQLLLSLQGGT